MKIYQIIARVLGHIYIWAALFLVGTLAGNSYNIAHSLAVLNKNVAVLGEVWLEQQEADASNQKTPAAAEPGTERL
jgi:hypothetical protein